MPEQAVLLFAKAPIPGTVKTRLETVLSQQQTADLHWQLVQQVYQQAQNIKDVSMELWVSAEHANWSVFTGVSRFIQQGEDLGQRLYHALTAALKRYKSVVIIGSDCPFINKAYLKQAFEALRNHDVVLGPATDGGYVLIAANKADSRLFENIDWGSERVLAQTHQQLVALGWKWQELDTLADIDRPEDLPLLAELPAFKSWANLDAV